MANPRKTRGEYRPIFEALFTGKDYRALSPDAKLTLLTLKGLCGAMGIKVWPALAESLSELTGMPTSRVKTALASLTSANWIEAEDGIVWIVRGLEFEPQISHGEKHRSWFRTAIDSLPRSPIVARMCAAYAHLFGYTPPIPHRNPIDSLSISHAIPTTSPSLSPSTSLSPTTATVHSQGERTIADDVLLLTIAANAGISVKYGEQPNPIHYGHSGAIPAAEALRAEGVDVEFAHAVVFAYASTLTLDRPPRSLRYFTEYVIERWRAEKARRDATGYRPETAKPAPEMDQMRTFAIRYAREGVTEYQAYCDDRGIAWRDAA